MPTGPCQRAAIREGWREKQLLFFGGDLRRGSEYPILPPISLALRYKKLV